MRCNLDFILFFAIFTLQFVRKYSLLKFLNSGR